MVVGPPSFLPPPVSQAWERAGVDLQGPVAAAELPAALAGSRPDGAVIDVAYDVPALLDVVELLDDLGVRALFAASKRKGSAAGGFTLSTDGEAINAFVQHLLGSNEMTHQ